MMRSGNPALKASTFEQYASLPMEQDRDTMTLQGTVNKSILLMVLLVLPAAYVWDIFFQTGDPQSVMLPLWAGLGGGFIFAMITIFKHTWAPVTAPVYAVLEGMFLGAISAIFEAQYPGIVVQAVALTMGIFFMLLMAYKSRLIKATENFKLGVTAATGGIFIVYMMTWILGFFGISMPFIHDSGPMGIGISLFIVVIASLNLVLDFDFIEEGAEKGAPKHMEWYGAFGLLVTLVWLYLEILRLLAKLRN